ncbi:MAG TPA: glycerophosphodiester phosphodiesterase [Thermomonospora sp.]|nr:glycerophosphodiester phosphodiesterase [Thermomonospora sp.]
MRAPHTTAISAHRRDHHGAFETAAGSGAEYVEIDVRRTADGELVAHHDAQVGGLPLARCTYERARAAVDRPVPLVREALEAIAGRALGHLDLKERGCEHEAVALALDRLGPGRFVVTTRSAESIRLIKRDFPQVRTALSVGRGLWERGAVRDLSPLALVRACGADMVALNHRLARLGVLGRCARAGFPAMVWTVNAEPLMRRFLGDPRVAVLVTDHPRRALALRDEGR